MAILTILADQLVDGFRAYPIDEHGKLRSYYGENTPPAVAGDDGSMINLFKLPPGRQRLWPHLSRLRWTAFGASRVLKLGYRAFYSSAPPAAVNAEDDDAFFAALDISTAGNTVLSVPMSAVTLFKYDIYSRTEVTIFGTVTGGTWPTTGVIEGMLVTTYE